MRVQPGHPLEAKAASEPGVVAGGQGGLDDLGLVPNQQELVKGDVGGDGDVRLCPGVSDLSHGGGEALQFQGKEDEVPGEVGEACAVGIEGHLHPLRPEHLPVRQDPDEGFLRLRLPLVDKERVRLPDLVGNLLATDYFCRIDLERSFQYICRDNL